MLNKILKPFDLIEQFLRRFKFIIFLLIAINVINTISDMRVDMDRKLDDVTTILKNPVEIKDLNRGFDRVWDSVSDVTMELRKIRNGQRN